MRETRLSGSEGGGAKEFPLVLPTPNADRPIIPVLLF